MNYVNVKSITCGLAICVLLIFPFATNSHAQKVSTRPFLWEDTAVNPHDFDKDYYATNGINAKAIIGRPTGTDLLSVFGMSSNPTHSSVRVLATLPGFGPSGELLFWYSLGELGNNGFTQDRAGDIAREAAMATPIYVFPLRLDNVTADEFFSFNNSRHAAIVGPIANDNKVSPLGLRLIVRVSYTPFAFTKEAVEMMEFMKQKNGEAVDDTPIIRTLGDIEFLLDRKMISLESGSVWDDGTPGVFAITPVIADPRNGAIAGDAFLLMSTKAGNSLPSEEIFNFHFTCLKKTGDWCKTR